MTSPFHFWQFQAYNSGAQWFFVALFWLALWKFFHFSCIKFCTGNIWISSPSFYHCVIVTPGFTSDNFIYMTLVQRDWQYYCFDWTCENISFLPLLEFEVGTSGPLVLHLLTVLWCLMCFTSDIYRYLIFGAKGLLGMLLWLHWWEFFFGCTTILRGTSWTVVLHCTILSLWFMLFTSENFKYSTLMQRVWLCSCSDLPSESLYFCLDHGLNWEFLDI